MIQGHTAEDFDTMIQCEERAFPQGDFKWYSPLAKTGDIVDAKTEGAVRVVHVKDTEKVDPDRQARLHLKAQSVISWVMVNHSRAN